MKIAINGFGRIGRSVLSLMAEQHNEDIEVVAINDLMDVATAAHLLKYDSVRGISSFSATYDDEHLIINEKKVKWLSHSTLDQLPWKTFEVDLVIEATGRFTAEKDARQHLEQGAKQVLISAPAKGNVPTVIIGINHKEVDIDNEPILSSGSCTTNAIAPVLNILQNQFGIQQALMSTIHAYTADQRLQDAPHKDLRRARAASMSIIPTTTGATNTVEKAIPSLTGKLSGLSYRVPVANGSIAEISATLENNTTIDEVKEVIAKEIDKRYRGVLSKTSAPLVSVDIIGRSESGIIDDALTFVNGNNIKLAIWYDNEWGISNRIVDIVKLKQTVIA